VNPISVKGDKGQLLLEIGMMIPHSRPTISENDISNVVTNLRSGLVAYGDEVTRFEQDMSKYIGVLGGVATNSGTSALHLALKALDIGPGHEIILPSYVCVSVLHAVKYCGASPVFADIGDGGYNLDSKSVDEKITANTKAIIVPHLFGTAADLAKLMEFGIPIIEDCAQAVGAEYRGQKLGSFGILSTFSFKATKLMTTGHGGMVMTNSREMLDRLRELAKYDELREYHVSYNYQLTDFQAALGRSQLKQLDSFIERRRRISKTYDEVFASMGQKVQTANGICFRYVVEVDNAERYIEPMKLQGVNCARPVFKPLHQYFNSHTELRNTDMAIHSVISIPIYPSLNDDEVVHICKIVEKVWREAKGGYTHGY
jgi:perosamine synthetase